MPLYKFGRNDVFNNQIKTHPKNELYIYEQCVIHNNQPNLSNAFADVNYSEDAEATLKHVPCGYTSLYELNVGRPTSSVTPATSDVEEKADFLIYPFITKDGSLTSFKTVSQFDYYEAEYGDITTGSYPLSASIVKDFFGKFHEQSNRQSFWLGSDPPGNISNNLGETSVTLPPEYAKTKFGNKIEALQNVLNSYSSLSPHYLYASNSFQPTHNEHSSSIAGWNKDLQEIGLISIPSIFYGSSIQKGSVNLKFFITGTLIGELRDANRNGELIQVGPTGSYLSGSTAGVVLYDHGFILLTGTWNVASSSFTTGSHAEAYAAGNNIHPTWTHFASSISGAYAGEDGTVSTPSSSYYMSFNGTQYVPTKTMLAHAPKGELNFSNNPTYIKFGQVTGTLDRNTGSVGSDPTNSLIPPMVKFSNYTERKDLKIKHIARSPHFGSTGSFKKQTYISKIGIFDEDRNLVAIAKLANPVKKTEDRDYTFKLKLDF